MYYIVLAVAKTMATTTTTKIIGVLCTKYIILLYSIGGNYYSTCRRSRPVLCARRHNSIILYGWIHSFWVWCYYSNNNNNNNITIYPRFAGRRSRGLMTSGKNESLRRVVVTHPKLCYRGLNISQTSKFNLIPHFKKYNITSGVSQIVFVFAQNKQFDMRSYGLLWPHDYYDQLVQCLRWKIK